MLGAQLTKTEAALHRAHEERADADRREVSRILALTLTLTAALALTLAVALTLSLIPTPSLTPTPTLSACCGRLAN